MNFELDDGPGLGGSATTCNWEPPAYLCRLEAVSGAGLLVELIEAFRSDTAARLQRLRDALADGDPARAGREAHAIKGSSSQLGACEMLTLCQLIEYAASSCLPAQVAELVERLETSFAELSGGMAAYCAARERPSFPTPPPIRGTAPMSIRG